MFWHYSILAISVDINFNLAMARVRRWDMLRQPEDEVGSPGMA